MPKRFDAPPPSHKVCIKCGARKVISEFSKDAGMYDNYKNTCKACVRKYNKQYRAANLEAERARDRSKYLRKKKKG